MQVLRALRVTRDVAGWGISTAIARLTTFRNGIASLGPAHSQPLLKMLYDEQRLDKAMPHLQGNHHISIATES